MAKQGSEWARVYAQPLMHTTHKHTARTQRNNGSICKNHCAIGNCSRLSSTFVIVVVIDEFLLLLLPFFSLLLLWRPFVAWHSLSINLVNSRSSILVEWDECDDNPSNLDFIKHELCEQENLHLTKVAHFLPSSTCVVFVCLSFNVSFVYTKFIWWEWWIWWIRWILLFRTRFSEMEIV